MLCENEQLTEYFEDVKCLIDDDFYIKGQCEYPDIIIPEIASKKLSLPLTYDIVSKIQKKSISSSFGKGMETKHDLNVRNSLEITAKQFILNNFDLSSKTSELLNQIKCKLSPHSCYITAEPLKLLIYEKNCFFKSHHDTMKNDNHFGSLILSIPCINNYKGGQFNLYFDDKTVEWTPNKQYDENTNNIGKCEWIAFYSDTRHEIKRITEGMRITITFNLFIPYDGNTNIENIPFRISEYSQHLNEISEIIETYFPKTVSFIIIGYLPDHLLIDKIQNILLHERNSTVCCVSAHRYGGKQVHWEMLKGRDAFLYKWFAQYFTVSITPIIIRNVYQIEEWDDLDVDDNINKEKEFGRKDSENDTYWKISFGRYDGSTYNYIQRGRYGQITNDRIHHDQDVKYILGDNYESLTVYALYNDKDRDELITDDNTKDIEHLYWPETDDDNGGNWCPFAKEYQYHCFGFLLW